ncbi:class I SAM-dependent methyltransferase [Actibacterium ureilyticum]|uniref:class I SAM-dependent methyltransferase n=1 Tax=Actibacterium ureilyticum TaxID=1590614 RepID=UPI000BAB17A4|nr:class I SAM-dependent methyltransferase [Actibacterium ureilyticum]
MRQQPRPPWAFWDRIARKYAGRKIANPENYQATLTRTRSYLGPEDKVLELGAGTASTALLLAPGVGQYTASDFSAEMVKIGQEKLAADPCPNLRIVQGAPGDAALGDGPYDAVLAFNLLHLIPDLPAALEDSARRLRPGGLLISKTICIGHALHMRLLIAVVRRIFGVAFVARLTPHELEAQITAAGFQVIESASYPAGGRSRYIVARRGDGDL